MLAQVSKFRYLCKLRLLNLLFREEQKNETVSKIFVFILRLSYLPFSGLQMNQSINILDKTVDISCHSYLIINQFSTKLFVSIWSWTQWSILTKSQASADNYRPGKKKTGRTWIRRDCIRLWHKLVTAKPVVAFLTSARQTGKAENRDYMWDYFTKTQRYHKERHKRKNNID